MKKEHLPAKLLSSWKIIFGIILYIISAELLKEVIIFSWIEPYLEASFAIDTAENLSEVSEYILQAALLIPIAMYFVVRPVNRSNTALLQLNQKYINQNDELQQEIEKRKTADSELAKSENRYRYLYNHTPVMLHSINKEGKLLSVSEFWLEKMGYEREDVIGADIANYLTEDSQKIVKEEAIPRLIKEGRIKEFEYQFVKKNGETIDIELSAIAEYDSQGQFMRSLSVLYDISKRKQAEKKLILAKEKAERDAEKLQASHVELEFKTLALEQARLEAVQATRAKSQFLATMSHEIRTPMNGVMGTAQLLAKTVLTNDQRKYVKTLLTSGQQLLYVINDILDYSKLEANKLTLIEETFDPRACVKEVIDMMKSHAEEKKVSLYSVVDFDTSLLVLGDPIRLKQILNNLVNNAIKFTQKGEISLTVSLVSKDPPHVQLLFKIKDTGIGIPPDRIPSLFEEFTQADSSITRQTGGTGLGLSICQKLLHLMESELLVKSQEGVGSEFYFILPLLEIPEVNVAIDNDLSFSPSEIIEEIPMIEILVVEDNQINQMIAEDMLHALGHSVDIASNGQEALIQLEKKTYDLVLMDIHMPVMDGLTTTKNIMQNYPEANRPIIIALTADALSEEKERYLQTGMNDCLTKPLDLRELKTLLKKYSDPNNKLKKSVVAEESFAEPSIVNKLNPNLRNQLIQLFQEHSPPLIEALKTAAIKNDAHTIKESAHSLKGNALAIGATDLATFCASLQKAGEINQLDGIDADLIRLQDMYGQVVQQLNQQQC